MTGSGHPVGADVDLDVLVGGAQADLRLDERAAGARRGTSARGRPRRRPATAPGARRRPRAPPSGSPCITSSAQPLDRLGDDRQAQEAPHRRRRHAPVDRARPALLRVDVPARAALEPGAARRREPAAGRPGAGTPCARRSASPSGDSSRSKRGRSGSSPKRSSIICGSTMTRRPLSSGRRSLASSPRTSMPTRRGPWFSKRASRRIASRSAVGCWSCATSSALGRSGTRFSGLRSVMVSAAAGAARVPDLLHLEAVLDLLGRRRHRLGQPRVDPGSARDEPARRLRRAGAPPSSPARARACCVSPRRRLRPRAPFLRAPCSARRWPPAARRGGAALRAPSLVAQRDEQAPRRACSARRCSTRTPGTCSST